MPRKTKIRKRVALVILDGFGVNPSKANNAVLRARTPRLDEYFSRYPHTVLEASGEAVGLPAGQMGNSEVGHMTIGCGAVIRQDLIRINDAIADGSLFEVSPLVRAVKKAEDGDGHLHLIGLLSDGGVHSHINHIIALIKLCQEHGVRPLVHVIADGRDAPPKSVRKYIRILNPHLKQAGGAMATVMGRYYAMDRDRRWERTFLAWQALVQLEGRRAGTAQDAVRNAYARGETDEFILPTVLHAAQPMTAKSEVIFCNFRSDRPLQLSKALAQKEFDAFDRGPDYRPVRLTKMTKYSKRFLGPVAFPPRRRKPTCLKSSARPDCTSFTVQRRKNTLT